MPGERGRAVTGALTALLAVAACVEELPTAPGATTYVVHAILDPSSRVQLVLVERAFTGQPHVAAARDCVQDAVVTIGAPNGVAMRAVRRAGECGRYDVALDQYGVALVPGAAYTLLVRTADGVEITGSTTIPAGRPMDSAGAVERFSVLRDTLRLSFDPVPGNAHELRVASTYASSRRFVETGAAIAGNARELGGDRIFLPSFGSSDTTHVTVSAVDPNYYEYYRAQSDPFGGGSPVPRLQGASGVFGSIVVIQRRTLFVGQ